MINKQKEEEDARSAQELAATRGYYRDWVRLVRALRSRRMCNLSFLRMLSNTAECVAGLLDSTYHQSQLKSSWLKMVPLGQRKDTG